MQETIAAISTAMGQAGIGIVRMSGIDAFGIGKKVFDPFSKDKEIKNRYMTYGHIVDKDGKVIDEVLVSFMKAPNTYTREDIVEIYCHGGIISVKKILNLLLNSGARLAEKGEFTKRAFLNGRIDLSQAEAVIDIINADVDKIYDLSVKQLEGSLTNKVKEIKKSIFSMLTNMEYIINFMEDVEEEPSRDGIIDYGNDALNEVNKLLSTKNKGKIVREGIKTTIVGKPNVGKSSLLNILLNENRAIVTEIPGTTRDTIEESIDLDGIKLKITDTAGIRKTEDVVESIGVEKSIDLMKKSDLIIAIFDGSKELDDEDKEIINLLNNREAIIIFNKIDKGLVLSEDSFKEVKNKKIIKTSMIEKVGIDELIEAISEMFFDGKLDNDDELLITSERHINLLERTKKSLESSIEDVKRGVTLEACEIEVNNAYEYISEITGEAIGEEVLDSIFTQFCIGK